MGRVLLIPALVAAAVVHAALDGESGIGTWMRLRGELADARARTHALRLEIESLRGQLETLEAADPFAVEAAIREDLKLARPGETLLLLPRPPGPGEHASVRFR